MRVAENKAIHAIAKKRGYPCKNRGDGRQATSHGFHDGQTEGVFTAGTDVEVGGGIEIEHFFAWPLEKATLQNAKRFCCFTEGVRGINARCDHENWQIAKNAHGANNGFKSFRAPVVSNQEQYEITFLKVAASARFRAQREPRRRREVCCVDAIGDDADILALKIISEERRGALGDGDKRNLWILVNPPFQPRQESVVDAPVEPPKETGPCDIAILFVCKFLEAMEERVNEDKIAGDGDRGWNELYAK